MFIFLAVAQSYDEKWLAMLYLPLLKFIKILVKLSSNCNEHHADRISEFVIEQKAYLGFSSWLSGSKLFSVIITVIRRYKLAKSIL